MKKKYIAFVVLILLFFFGLSHDASAHFLQIDGTMGAVLHIDPNDAPLAGDGATLNFEFKNTAGTFILKNCNCTLSISHTGQKPFSEKLTESNSANATSSEWNVSLPYVFPDLAVYSIVVSGTSTNQSFQPFTLSYDIRVDTRGNQPLNPFQELLQQHLAHVVFFGGAFIIVAYIILSEQRKERKMIEAMRKKELKNK